MLQDASLRATFKKFDLDHDGTVTTKELRAIMARWGFPLTDASFAKFLDACAIDVRVGPRRRRYAMGIRSGASSPS